MWEPGALAASETEQEGTAVPAFLEVESKTASSSFPETGALLLGAMKCGLPERQSQWDMCSCLPVCVQTGGFGGADL